MSKALLKDHLLIEFHNDPEMDRGTIDADVNNIFDTWRKKSGRNYATNQVSRAFSAWWLKQFEPHLYREGQRISYRQFIKQLSEDKIQSF